MTGLDMKHARKHLGYTQAVLAEQLGVTPNTCARWEQPKGGFPIPTSIAILVHLLLELRQQEGQP